MREYKHSSFWQIYINVYILTYQYINVPFSYFIKFYIIYRTYPVYAVGEAGAMYTPASSQYYTPATTPVTYAQVIYKKSYVQLISKMIK